MRLLTALVLASCVLMIVSCDRYNHDFKDTTPNHDIQFRQFTTDFDSLATTYLNAREIDPLMNLYASDYYNSGVNRDSLTHFYQSLMDSTTVTYRVVSDTVNVTQQTLRYWIYKGDSTLVVSMFDKAKWNGTGFSMCGNGIDQADHAVLVEMFTATWCENCPKASEEVHELMEAYPGMIIPVEYICDFMHPEFSFNYPIRDWYLGSELEFPASVFMGKDLVRGGGPTDIGEYPSFVASAIGEEFPMLISDLACEPVEDSLRFSFVCTGALPGENLYLKYAVLEETSGFLYNSGDPLTNIALAWDKISHSGTGGSYEYTVPAPDDLPSDAKLVIWFQKVLPAWGAGLCPVYNSAETYIGR
jgi:thiol-disulfide isomerase/thioredoxin